MFSYIFSSSSPSSPKDESQPVTPGSTAGIYGWYQSHKEMMEESMKFFHELGHRLIDHEERMEDIDESIGRLSDNIEKKNSAMKEHLNLQMERIGSLKDELEKEKLETTNVLEKQNEKLNKLQKQISALESREKDRKEMNLQKIRMKDVMHELTGVVKKTKDKNNGSDDDDEPGCCFSFRFISSFFFC